MFLERSLNDPHPPPPHFKHLSLLPPPHPPPPPPLKLLIVHLGYIHTWFWLLLFHIIRPCVSVHFLGPLIQFSICHLHCLLSVCIIVLASVPNFYSFIFLMLFQFGPHIMQGCVILLLEFHRFSADFMFIWSLLVLVILPDWFYPLYLLFCSVFSSHLIPFHLYKCSPHLHLWSDLKFGNVILIHQHIPTLY